MPILTVDIVLDKPRKLAFTLRSMKSAAARPVSPEGQANGLAHLDTLLFALHDMLLYDDPKLTVAEVENMLDPGNLRYAAEKIESLLKLYEQENPGFLSALRPEAAETPQAAKPTGPRSGPMRGTILGSRRKSSGN